MRTGSHEKDVKAKSSKAKDAVHSRDVELELFCDVAHDLMVVTDEAGKILKANKTFKDVTGYSDEELSSMHFMDLFGADDKPYIRNTIQAFDLSELDMERPVFDFEARVQDKCGELHIMEWRQQLCNGLLYCAGKNISEIKLQKEALSKREKQLCEAESIGRMGHWHWAIGEEDMEWSDEIYRIFGVEKGHFKPTLHAMNGMVKRADIARVNQAFQRALIEENDYDMEFQIRRPSDEVRYIRCEGRCGRDEQGEVVALYGIMQDMTERMMYEKELRAAKEGAERAYAAKTQFLANMSHELRTPLNAIIGFSEMIEQQLLGPIGTEKYLEYIGGIRESGTHLLDLISDILDMSKIEAGKYELDLEELSILKVIQLSLHMMEGRSVEAQVKISLLNEVSEGLKLVADRRAVLQILLNILSNAVKFTPEQGRVDVECLERDDYILLKITDTGIGIPAHKLASVTKPFEQVSSSYARDHEGSGLGLAITKELIGMHGGVMSIESELDVGTCVSVRLPKLPKI